MAVEQVAMAQVWLIVALIALVTGLTGMMSRAWITQPLWCCCKVGRRAAKTQFLIP